MRASARSGYLRPAGAVALAFLSIIWWGGLAAAAPRVPSNELDTTFGEDGVVITDLPFTGEAIHDVALQSDGKIVARGLTELQTTVNRYESDGRLDPTFHVSTHPFDGSLDAAMAVQADQKIVIGGTLGDWMYRKFALQRMNADGTADRTFGVGGTVITDFPMDVWLQAIAIQEDGKILAGGHGANFGDGFVLARYLPEGRLDRSFGSRGVAWVKLGTDPHLLTGLAVQPDGKIVANGYLSSSSSRLGLVRLEPDGSLDPIFGEGGVVIMNEFVGFQTSALALQPDGGILSGGSYDATPLTCCEEFGLVRHLPDGTLDLGFGDNGVAHIYVAGLGSIAEDLALEPNGLIVQAGWSPDEGDEQEVNIVWWQSDGSLYGEEHRLFGGTAFGYAVVVQPDGKAIVAGSGGSGYDDLSFRLARFLAT